MKRRAQKTMKSLQVLITRRGSGRAVARPLFILMMLAGALAACEAVLGIGDYKDRVADGGTGGTDASADGTAGDSGTDSSSDGSTDAGPSCASTCGPSGSSDCCGSSVVDGGTYFRDNDGGTTVSDFRLDTYEITVGRFRKFVGVYAQNMIDSGAGKNPHNSKDTGWDTAWNTALPADASALKTKVKCDGAFQTWTNAFVNTVSESRPMNCITWFEAEAFCTWDGGRLPTEAEWQYASAGGTEGRTYPWGTTVPSADALLAVYGCYYGNGDAGGDAGCANVTNIAAVGSVSAGNGKWGQADMAGNVFEWVQDWYATPYPAADCKDCANLTPSGSIPSRVYRGGGFIGKDAANLQASSRFYDPPVNRNGLFGARCARTP